MSHIVMPAFLSTVAVEHVPRPALPHVLHHPYLARFLHATDILGAWTRLGLHCDPYCYIDPGTRVLFNPSNVTIGYGSCIAGRSELHAWEPITIGRCVFLSAGA